MAPPDLRGASLSQDPIKNSGPSATNFEGEVRAAQAYSSELEFEYNPPANYEENLPPYTMANESVCTSSPVTAGASGASTPTAARNSARTFLVPLDLEGQEPLIRPGRRSIRSCIVQPIAAITEGITEGITTITNGVTICLKKLSAGIVFAVTHVPSAFCIACVVMFILAAAGKFALAWKALDRPPNL